MVKQNDVTKEETCDCSLCKIQPYTYEIPETNRTPGYNSKGVSLD